MKKRSIWVIILLIVVVFALNFETVGKHYSADNGKSENYVGYVVISVDANQIAENKIIVPEIEIPISDDDTAFSVLNEILTEQKIHFDYAGVSGNSVYVKAIDNIYEYDYGDLSGWMYSVNDNFPTISSSEYILHDGDIVKWVYTRDLGRDVGDNYYAK